MKWFTVHVGGQKWTVELVAQKNPNLQGDTAPIAGICLADRSKIYIAKETSSEAREDTLLHELLHAAFFVAGATGEWKDDNAEERVVSSLTPVLHRLLKDLGFKFPQGPA